LVVIVILFTILVIDVFSFPEKYITTAKYHLHNDLLRQDAEAIEYYKTAYLEKGVELFDDIDIDNSKMVAQTKEDVQVKINTPKEIKTVYMGDFVATAYCVCIKCCGKTPQHPAYGITASGKRATPGRTVAVDPNVIPLGSTVIVNGTEFYVAEDTGKAIKGNRLDICFSTHESALQFGRQIVEVEVIF
jgi:3D (Asp-Asp-Asp) domain-containing protein